MVARSFYICRFINCEFRITHFEFNPSHAERLHICEMLLLN